MLTNLKKLKELSNWETQGIRGSALHNPNTTSLAQADTKFIHPVMNTWLSCWHIHSWHFYNTCTLAAIVQHYRQHACQPTSKLKELRNPKNSRICSSLPRHKQSTTKQTRNSYIQLQTLGLKVPTHPQLTLILYSLAAFVQHYSHANQHASVALTSLLNPKPQSLCKHRSLSIKNLAIHTHYDIPWKMRKTMT